MNLDFDVFLQTPNCWIHNEPPSLASALFISPMVASDL